MESLRASDLPRAAKFEGCPASGSALADHRRGPTNFDNFDVGGVMP